MALTSDNFVEQVTLKGALPDGRYTDAEILAIGYNQLMSIVYPLIISLREEYYVKNETQQITAGQSHYSIPARAWGLSLRELKRIYNTTILDIDRIAPEEIISTTAGDPIYFYLEGQDVVLYPTPAASDSTLKISFFNTPNVVVATNQCAKITNIDRNTGIITAVTPSAWTTSNTFDFISAKNGHRILASDLTASNVSGSTVTFNTSDIPSALSNNDYIALAGESPFFEMPDAAWSYLVQLTVSETLEAMEANQALANSRAKEAMYQQALISAMNVRVQGSPKSSAITII